MQSRMRARGFTLIELSIVLLILSLMMAMGFQATLGMLEQSRKAATEAKLDAIENALMSYRMINNRLPMPADISFVPGADYGLAQANWPTISWAINPDASPMPIVTEGAVPVQTLGLPADMIFDGWGHKFYYVVPTYATEIDAFNLIHPWDSCGIEVNDASATARTTGALYVLVSAGPNGHGAFDKSGATARLSSGNSNLDELINCHCDVSGQTAGIYTYPPQFVQKEATQDSNGLANDFDDIVRYKMRWQMINDEDQRRFTYYGPQILLGGPSNIGLYKNECGHLTKLPSTLPGTNASVGFTPKQQHIFTYSQDFGGTCKLYKFSGSTYTDLGAGVMDNCPSNGDSAVLTKSGYLLMRLTSSPYLKLWKLKGDHFYSLFLPGISPVSPALTGEPSHIAIDDKANFLALSASSNAGFYRRAANGTYTKLAQPTSTTLNNTTMSISPDGQFLLSADNLHTYRWRIGADGFTISVNTAFLSSTGVTAPNVLNVSPNSQRIFIAYGISSGLPYGTTGMFDFVSSTSEDMRALTSGSVTVQAFSPDSNSMALEFSLNGPATADPHLMYLSESRNYGAYSASSWFALQYNAQIDEGYPETVGTVSKSIALAP